MGIKLTHALYFRETRKFLTPMHQFFCSTYQPQMGDTQQLTDYLKSLLPNLTVGYRSNIPNYGDTFRYMSGYKLEDFFVYAAQFGHGMMIWGVVCGPMVSRPTSGVLGSGRWRSGACGAGSNNVALTAIGVG
jgi:hypothetical protein